MTSPRLQFSPMEVLRAEQARLASMRKQAVIDKNEDLVNNIDSALGDIVNAMEDLGDAVFDGPRSPLYSSAFGLRGAAPIAIAPPHKPA